jgi:hypothetical protein
MDSTFVHGSLCVICGYLGCNEAKIDEASRQAKTATRPEDGPKYRADDAIHFRA